MKWAWQYALLILLLVKVNFLLAQARTPTSSKINAFQRSEGFGIDFYSSDSSNNYKDILPTINVRHLFFITGKHLESFSTFQITSLSHFTSFDFERSTFALLMLESSFDHIKINNCAFKDGLGFLNVTYSRYEMRENNCKYLNIYDCSLGDLTIFSNVDMLKLDNDTIKGSLLISDSRLGNSHINCLIGGTIQLLNISIDDGLELDIYDIKPLIKGTKIPLNLEHSEIEKINLNYQNCSLFFSPNTPYDIKSNTYLKLLNNFKERGYYESYELADIEYQKLKYTYEGIWYKRLYDEFQLLWWNYGYDKWYIFIWTFGFLTIFSICNCWWYKKMNRVVYTLDEFEPKATGSFIQRVAMNYYYSIIYTSVIFFSFSVKIDKLKFRHKRLLFWFIVIYIVGVICLAYLANFVLKSSI